MSTHYPSLLLVPLAVLCSAITYHSSSATTQKQVDDVYPGSISHSLMAHLRSRRSPSPSPSHFPGREPGPSPPGSHAPPECAEGCCGRTHVCGLRGCAFKARCGVDCCPPEVVQDLKLRAQRLTLAAAGVPDAPRPLPNNNNNQNNHNNQNNNNNGHGPMRSYKKDGDIHHHVVVHEKPLRPSAQHPPPQQQMQHLQQQQVNQRHVQQNVRQQQQQGRNQQGPHNGQVDRQSERIREPPSPPPMNPGRPSPPFDQHPPPPHPPIDHPHRKAGSMAPHPHTNGPSGLAPSQGAFGPSSRGGFSAAVNERRAVENANSGMQAPPPGRMTFSSKPQNLRPPPGKSMGPKRPPAFTNRPPSIESPIMRPAAFGASTSEQEQMPFISRVKRCCECCMPDCHHGCIRNGGCGMCQALTGNQNNNNSGITRGARTKQHN